MEKSKIPTRNINSLSDDEIREVVSFMYAVDMICRETGHGQIVIDIAEGKITKMEATHTIRPKYI